MEWQLNTFQAFYAVVLVSSTLYVGVRVMSKVRAEIDHFLMTKDH